MQLYLVFSRSISYCVYMAKWLWQILQIVIKFICAWLCLSSLDASFIMITKMAFFYLIDK